MSLMINSATSEEFFNAVFFDQNLRKQRNPQQPLPSSKTWRFQWISLVLILAKLFLLRIKLALPATSQIIFSLTRPSARIDEKQSGILAENSVNFDVIWTRMKRPQINIDEFPFYLIPLDFKISSRKYRYRVEETHKKLLLPEFRKSVLRNWWTLKSATNFFVYNLRSAEYTKLIFTKFSPNLLGISTEKCRPNLILHGEEKFLCQHFSSIS